MDVLVSISPGSIDVLFISMKIKGDEPVFGSHQHNNSKIIMALIVSHYYMIILFPQFSAYTKLIRQ